MIIALVFRALPHSVLVAGYLPFFINSAEIQSPYLEAVPLRYMVSLGQSSLCWLPSISPLPFGCCVHFSKIIPAELDEAARVDGCTHFQAFRWVIMPVMWPGVITTGLFSFLLAYNDFLVTRPVACMRSNHGTGYHGLF